MAFKEYGQPVDIVIDMLNMQPLSVTITSGGVTPQPDGELFIERGTPLYGATNPFDERQTVLSVDPIVGDCYGLTRYRVYFEEDGSFSDGHSMVYGGVVDSAKIPDYATIITPAIKEALPLLTFRAGREVLE